MPIRSKAIAPLQKDAYMRKKDAYIPRRHSSTSGKLRLCKRLFRPFPHSPGQKVQRDCSESRRAEFEGLMRSGFIPAVSLGTETFVPKFWLAEKLDGLPTAWKGSNDAKLPMLAMLLDDIEQEKAALAKN